MRAAGEKSLQARRSLRDRIRPRNADGIEALMPRRADERRLERVRA
jgi:hypothetical protein